MNSLNDWSLLLLVLTVYCSLVGTLNAHCCDPLVGVRQEAVWCLIRVFSQTQTLTLAWPVFHMPVDRIPRRALCVVTATNCVKSLGGQLLTSHNGWKKLSQRFGQASACSVCLCRPQRDPHVWLEALWDVVQSVALLHSVSYVPIFILTSSRFV